MSSMNTSGLELLRRVCLHAPMASEATSHPGNGETGQEPGLDGFWELDTKPPIEKSPSLSDVIAFSLVAKKSVVSQP